MKTEVDGRRSRYCCGDGGDCEQKLQMGPLLVVLNFGARGFSEIWLGEKGWNRSSSRWSEIESSCQRCCMHSVETAVSISCGGGEETPVSWLAGSWKLEVEWSWTRGVFLYE